MISRFSRFSRLASCVTGLLAIVSGAHVVRDGDQMAAFDRQYTHPTPANGGVEWKYFQLVEDSQGASSASISVLFYQGYVIQIGPRDPSLPEFYLDISGTFKNGSTFSFTVPAESATITACGQEVTGTWGNVARFKGSPDLSTYTAQFNAPQFGITGSFQMKSRGKPHVACHTGLDSTTFSSAVAGAHLTPAEEFIFRKVGWMISIPGGKAAVDLVVKGTKLQFTGQAYHDGNYAPGPFSAQVETWYSAVGQVGDYDLGFMYLVPVNSSKILSIGYLALGGHVLQQQCSVSGLKTNDAVSIAPYGVVQDSGTGTIVPAGFILDYTLVNGERHRFNLTSPGNVQIVNQVIYHRWVGRIKGGKVGGRTFEGPFLYEWLNPQFKTYVPPP